MNRHVAMVAGLVAAALLVLPACASELPPVKPAELQQQLAAKQPGLVVLDVRSAEEFATGHVPGALNVPHDQVESRLAELAAFKDQQVVLYCRSGRRAGLAAEVLARHGFKRLAHLEGDIAGWTDAGLPVAK